MIEKNKRKEILKKRRMAAGTFIGIRPVKEKKPNAYDREKERAAAREEIEEERS